MVESKEKTDLEKRVSWAMKRWQVVSKYDKPKLEGLKKHIYDVLGEDFEEDRSKFGRKDKNGRLERICGLIDELLEGKPFDELISRYTAYQLIDYFGYIKLQTERLYG